jgi:hypothetical protein
MILANQSKRTAAYTSIFERYGATEGPPDLPDDAFAAVGARKKTGSNDVGAPKATSSGKRKAKPR